MAQTPTFWLDCNYLSAVLQGGEDNEPKVTIVDFDVSPAVPPGNNYHSNIYKVVVKHRVGESDREETTSLIVKSHIEEGFFGALIKKSNLFSKEKRMYTEFLPYINKLFNTEFAPKSFYCPIGRSDVIVKDLKNFGYVTCNKFNKLKYPHCKLVFDVIAKFHATSVAFKHKTPNSRGRNSNDAKRHGRVRTVLHKNVAHVTSKIEGCKAFSDMISNKADHLWESYKTQCKQKSTGLNVLNHGDLWMNNVLFKHDESGNVVDAKVIDFQVPKYASPVFDLLYFMWTSAAEEVLDCRQQELYDHYLQTLNTTLEQLGCHERLTVEELREDLVAASDYVIVVICYLLPHMMVTPEDTSELEELDSSESLDEKNEKMFHSRHFKALLPSHVRQFQKWAGNPL